MPEWTAEIAQFVETARRAAEYGLLSCSSGNLSLRLNDELCLVTATRSWLGKLTPEQVAICRVADGSSANGVKPSVEAGFHTGILRVRPDIRVVLHFQSPAATTFACRRDADTVNYAIIPEVPVYIGPIAVVPYLPPGSAELAQAIIPAMTGHNLALLRNHGLVTVGCSLDDALQKAAFFELACQILLAAGAQAQLLPDVAVRALQASGRG